MGLPDKYVVCWQIDRGQQGSLIYVFNVTQNIFAIIHKVS